MTIDHPLVLLGGGIYSLLFILSIVKIFLPTKKLNALGGYRSALAKENQKNWDFAQHYVPRLILQVSFIFICLSFLGIWAPLEDWMCMLIVAVSLIIFSTIIYLKTEAAIKENLEEFKGF